MKKHVLVAGSPGSGKTYLAAIAREWGTSAFDADLLPGLSGWFHRTGAPVQFPAVADATFFREHRFLWSRAVLERFLTEQPVAYLFGMAANAFDVLDMFDRGYFLHVSDGTLSSRLTHPSRENPVGATLAQRRILLDAARDDLERATTAGLTILDGEAPVETILDEIRRG